MGQTYKKLLAVVFTLLFLLLFSSVQVYAEVDLVINLSDSPDPVAASGFVTYSISIENNGDSISDTTSLAVTIPATTTYSTFASTDGVTCDDPGGVLTCEFGSLEGFPANQRKTVDIEIQTLEKGIITLWATASTSGTDDIPDTANSDSEDTTVYQGADVALVKTASVAEAPAGSSLSYSFAVTNNGPDAATMLRIGDQIYSGFNLTSLPSECSNSGGTIICDLDGSIASGETRTIGPISGIITSAGGSTITNAATVALQPFPGSAATDPNTDDNTSTVNTTVTAGSDVKIVKSRSIGGSLLVGTDFNFILSPSYSGDSPQDLTVTDSIPVNYTIQSGSFLTSQNGWECGFTGQDVTCTRPAGGDSGVYNQALGDIVIPVTVESSGANVSNSTTINTNITDPDLDPDHSNNTATDGGVNLLDPTVNLDIDKTGPIPNRVVVEVPFNFNVNVSNNGNTGFYGIARVTDTIPPNLTVNSYTPNGWICSPAAPVGDPINSTIITCERIYTFDAPLAAGATSSSIVMTAETATSGTFLNEATITTPDCNLGNLATCNDGDTDTYSVISSVALDSADISVIKRVIDINPVLAGDELTYSLEIVNSGPDPSTDVRLTDTFSNLINDSAGATGAGFIDAVSADGLATLDECTYSESGRTLSCTYASVPVCVAGSDCPVVTVRVRPGGDGGERSNTANVISYGTADPDHSNETSTVTSNVTPRADITVEKAATPSSIAAGQNLTYVVNVINNGPSRAENVIMTDTLPVDVTFVSAASSVGPCGTTPTEESTTTSGNDTVSCNLNSIDNGSRQTVTLVVRPNTVTSGNSLTNYAEAITSTLETDGPANAVNPNNFDSVSASVSIPTLDLVLNKDDSLDPVAVGEQTIYTIDVTNSGPSAAEDVVVTDTLPIAGLSYISSSSTNGPCSIVPTNPGENTVSCDLGYMASNTQQTITVVMQGEVKGGYTNIATVTSNETALNYENDANNSVEEQTTVRTKADMQVFSKIATPATVDVRDDFLFTIKIRNNSGTGLAEADDVEVSDSLPADMVLTGAPTVEAPSSGSTTLSTCTGVAGDTAFSCSLGTVATDTEVDITVPVQLIRVASLPQVFTNTASVTTSSLDVLLSNNRNTGDGKVSVNSSSISGKVFRDFNADGSVTVGDSGIFNVTISLTGTSFDNVPVSASAITNPDGEFIITGLPASNASGYTITEVPFSEDYLNDGVETVGNGADEDPAVDGVIATPDDDKISAITLDANKAATGYLFAEIPIARIGIAKQVSSGPTVQDNGTFLTTFQLLVENFSLEQVNTIVVTDTLAGVFPSFGDYVVGPALNDGEYTIHASPSGDCSGLVDTYTGLAPNNIIATTSLDKTSSCTIDFTVRARPTIPMAVPYLNQATINGTGTLSTQSPADTSVNGDNPDPDNNDLADESSPTPVSPVYGPTISISKAINGTVSLAADLSVIVPVQLTVENTGNEPLNTISVSDDLASRYGSYLAGGAAATLTNGEYTIQTNASGTCSNIDAGFDGNVTTELAAFAALAIGDSCTIDFSYRFMPTTSTSYQNRADVSATSDYSTTAISDNDLIATPYPRLGLAKQVVGSSTTNADGTVSVPLSFVVENLGGESLSSVSISDDLSGASPQFGSHVASDPAETEYSIETGPAFSGSCSSGAANSSFNGDGDPVLASIGSFASGASCTITTTVRFRPGPPLPAGGNFTNQASATATGTNSGLAVADLSDDGINTDTDNDGIADEPGENDPTPVNVSFTPQVALNKSVNGSATTNADGTVTTPFRLTVTNSGTEPLLTINVDDTMAGVAPLFGSFVAGPAASLSNGEYTIETAPSFNGTCSTGSLIAGYDGDTQTELASLTRLEVLDSCDIDFTLRFRPTSPLPIAGYSNQGTTAGTGEFSGGAPVTDLSQDGLDPDPDGNDDPTDNSDPTPVAPSHTPAIGIAKQLTSGTILATGGGYRGTFQLVIENLGNEELQSVSINDAMNSAPANLGSFVSGGAGATLSAGEYTIESTPTFIGVCTNGTENAAFNGEGDSQLATISDMAIGASCTLEYDFRFVPQPGVNYFNQATSSGTGAFSTTPVSDLSDDGTDPDPNSNDDATEAGEDDPTPIEYPRIGLAKQLVSSSTTNADGTVTASFSLVVSNLGGEDLTGVDVSDDLSGASPQFGGYVAGGAAAVLAANEYTIETAPAFSGACTNGSLTAGFDGDTTPSLATISSFASGAACTLTTSIRFRPGTPFPAGGNYENQATVSATGSSGIPVTDQSDDGTDPDTDNDGVGNEPGENDPTPVNVSFTPQVALNKSLNGVATTNADGTITAPFRLKVTNSGTEPLLNISVTDTLAGLAPLFDVFDGSGDLQNGEYTIETAPTFNSGCTTGSLTAGYEGDAQNELATFTRLDVLDSCEVDFTLRFKPTSPLPGAGYSNQATTAADGEFSGDPVTDLSQNGLDPDPDANDDPTDNSDPTPVVPSHTPAIGIAKELTAGAILATNEGYRGTFQLVVENLGNEELLNVSVNDAMNTAPSNLGAYIPGGNSAILLAGQYTIESDPTFIGACTNGAENLAFTGTADTELATISDMAIGASCTLEYGFRFVPQPGINYVNQATAGGTGAFSTTAVTDLSDDGTDPDSNGNDDATEAGENDPTPIEYPRIGLAKQVAGSSTTNDDGTVTVPFSFVVENLGGETLSGVNITDDLSGASPQFGEYLGGGSMADLATNQYTIETSPALSSCSGGTLTSNYDGDTQPSFATIGSFSSGATCTLTTTIRFRPGLPFPVGGNYENQAEVSATGASSGISITDLSDDGVTPDSDGDGVGNEPGENDLTLVPVTLIPQIALNKQRIAAETINPDGTVTVPFRIKVTNSGTEPLVNISVTDTLSGLAPLFGVFDGSGDLQNGEYTIETAPSFNSACTTGSLTAGYEGNAQNQLATFTRLDVLDSCEIDFALRFKPISPLPGGGYSNQGTATADGEFSSTPVTDLSQNGLDPDPDGNGDPTDNDDPTPVNPVHTAAIGIAKTLQSGLLINSNGSYSGTFQLLVENLGNEELRDVSINDAMDTVPSNLGSFVADGGVELVAGQYTIESAPTFIGSCDNSVANGSFNGESAPQLATISELAVGTSCTLEYGFRFVPQPGTSYLNQATTAGTGAFSAGPVNDLSDDGLDPDTNGNSDATEAGENDPTPIPIPRIGLAKSVGAVVNNGDGTYDVPFVLTLINAGETALASVQITDELAEFGSYTVAVIPAAGEYSISSDPTIVSPSNGAALTAVAAGAFTGEGAGTGLLIPASSSLPNFGGGSESAAEIHFTLRFFPTTPGPFNNSASATGSSPAGGDVTDDSVSGNTPDADGNGDPGDDDSPTVVNLSGQVIGVAKAVGSIVQLTTKSYDIPYSLILVNPSTTITATNVQLSDNLSSTFPTAVSVSISSPATISACSGTVLNVAVSPFDGTTQTQLLVGNQNLQPTEQCTISFTARVDFGSNPLPEVLQNNSAVSITAETAGGIQIASDLSDNGIVPDPNDNGNASDSDENDPTPVDFSSSNLSSVSGTIWVDSNHDRIDNDGAATNLPTFSVEVLNSAGNIVGTATSDENGNYSVDSLFPSTLGDPSTYYDVRFRESVSGAIYGNPLSQDPANPNGTIDDGIINALQLVPGTNTVQQDLPLDPSGVVYDSVTRIPVAGATVTLGYTGSEFFDPSIHLVGGAANVTQVTGVSGFYQYILLGTAPDGDYSLTTTPPPGYVPTPSVMIPVCVNSPSVGANPNPALVQISADPPLASAPVHNPSTCPTDSSGFAASANSTQYYSSFNLTVGNSADVVNNHIPVDPVLGGAITLVKTSPLVNVSIGQLVPYTITATNTLSAPLSNIDLRDLLPPGFKYISGSANLDGVSITPTLNSRVLSLSDLTFPANGRRTIQMLLVVGAGVQPGEYINTVQAFNNLVPPPDNSVSNRATVAVRVIPDPVFDCSDVIGKVFDDQNANGYQDDGEPGIPSVRVATARGLLVTTDAEGRYHVTCAMVPNEFRGSNFIMKLDERTLPSGYRITTENPRAIHLTRGKMGKLNFGAAIHRVVRLEMTDAAFIADQNDPGPELSLAIDNLPEQLRSAPSIVRLAYNQQNETNKLIRVRLKEVRKRIEELWEEQGCCYTLVFEEEIFQRNLQGKGGDK